MKAHDLRPVFEELVQWAARYTLRPDATAAKKANA